MSETTELYESLVDKLGENIKIVLSSSGKSECIIISSNSGPIVHESLKIIFDICEQNKAKVKLENYGTLKIIV